MLQRAARSGPVHRDLARARRIRARFRCRRQIEAGDLGIVTRITEMRDDACIGCPEVDVFAKCDAEDVESAPGNKVEVKVVDHACCLEDAFGSGRDASGLGGGVERACEGALDREKVRGRRGRVRREVALAGPGDAGVDGCNGCARGEGGVFASGDEAIRGERMPSRVELSSGRGGW